MVIGPLASARRIAVAHPVTGFGPGGFSVQAPADAAPAAAMAKTVSAMPTAGGSLMLALQENVSQDLADREARRHGQSMIEELAVFQRALLSGTEAGTRDSLSRMAEIELRGVDPVLGRVLSSIRLRARIELQRLSKAPGVPI